MVKEEKNNKEQRPRKPETVPSKVVVGVPPNLTFRPPAAHLKGALTIIVSDGVNTASYTVHHPLGKTKLEVEDWVLTPTGDIQTLVDQRKNPDASRLDTMRRESRLRMAVASGLILEMPDGAIVYPQGGGIRTRILEHVKRLADEDHATTQVQWTKAGAKGDKPKKKSHLLFMVEIDRNQEEAVLAYMAQDNVVKASEAQWPDTFYTCSGQNFDQMQEGRCGGFKPPTAEDLFDGLKYQLNNLGLCGLAEAKKRKERGDYTRDDPRELWAPQQVIAKEPAATNVEKRKVPVPPAVELKTTSGGSAASVEDI
jgi:hypothetical protein